MLLKDLFLKCNVSRFSFEIIFVPKKKKNNKKPINVTLFLKGIIVLNFYNVNHFTITWKYSQKLHTNEFKVMKFFPVLLEIVK